MAGEVLVAFLQSPLYPDDTAALVSLLSANSSVRLESFPDLAALQQSSMYGRIEVLVVHFFTTADFLTVLRDNPVRWVHSYTVGVDKYLVPEFIESPIPLTNARGIYSQALAEFALYAVLHFTKDIERLKQQKASRTWAQFTTKQVSKLHMLVLGYGDMGQAVARTAAGFGIKVKGIRRTPAPDDIAESVHGIESLHTLLPEADVLVMCLPATEVTVDIIGHTELSLIKRGAIVINLGRGMHLNEAALVEALRSGKLRGAALDVYKKEPLEPENPLWLCPHLIMSNHNADHVSSLMASRNAHSFVSNLALYQTGKILSSPSLVTKSKGY